VEEFDDRLGSGNPLAQIGQYEHMSSLQPVYDWRDADAAEPALSSCTEGIWLPGNPTHLPGPLYRAATIDLARADLADIFTSPHHPIALSTFDPSPSRGR
jgi:hypothetical protein